MSVLARHEAVWDEMFQNPAFDTTGGSVDGGVLETARAVARPVVRRLRWRRGDGRGLDATIGDGVGELDRVWRGEVEEGGGLLGRLLCSGCVCTHEME
jgi:hypothetical protein